jgi:hypothetical protein
MRIAFYAPLKPPSHATPSGDRRVARLLLDALRLAGHRPFVASRLRSFDPTGARQAETAERGRRIAVRLVAGWQARPGQAPDLWFTYHLYYKAPDWLGPAVSAALGIPYVVGEASVAMKRAGGPWDAGHRAVVAALRADREGIMPSLADPARYLALPPFLDAGAYTSAQPGNDPPRLVAIAMMRPGDKLASYRILAEALARLRERRWELEVIGDGPARGAVETALAPLGSRVRYAGALGDAEIAGRLAAADLFVWPAINEAYGMAILEAQASGLPVVAGNSGGVGAIVADGVTGLLAPPGDAAAFAAALDTLLEAPGHRMAMGAAALDKVRREHDLPAAAGRLGAIVAALGRARAA